MKKFIIRITLVLLLLVTAGVAVLMFSLDSIVKKQVETIGSRAAKVDIKLDQVSISSLSGNGVLRGLFVGNPAGFQTLSAMKVGEISMALKLRSVLSGKIVIPSIRILAPEVTFERSLKDSNLGRILDNVQAFTATENETAQKGQAKAGRKLQVDDLTITGGKITLSTALLGGQSATLVLPEIQLQNLGAGPEGITSSELVERVFRRIFEEATKVGSEELKGLGKGLGKEAAGRLDKATKGMGDLFKKK